MLSYIQYYVVTNINNIKENDSYNILSFNQSSLIGFYNLSFCLQEVLLIDTFGKLDEHQHDILNFLINKWSLSILTNTYNNNFTEI